jgi:S1-C subfamily serine protease
VNREGEVVGISNAKVIGVREIAYAISIDSALPIISELITTGAVAWPYLGIVGSDNPAGRGVVIEDISPDGPAEEAGLRAGDIILSLDGHSMRDMSALREYILSRQVGEDVSVTYQRGTASAEAVVVLGRRPL